MKYRIPLALGAITAAVLATGLAWASDSGGPSDSSTSSTTSASTSTTGAVAPALAGESPVATEVETQVTIADGGSQVIVVENAGTVLVSRTGDSLRIVEATPNDGWSSEVEVASRRDVEGEFRSGTVEVEYDLALEDGSVRVRIEVDDDQGPDDRDDLGDDDESGPGSGGTDDDDGDENSGSDSDSDDDQIDDDD